MKNLIKKIYNKIFNDKNETYASLFKRFASFVLDSLIILIIFNITLITLQYFGYDIIIYQQEAVMQTDETVGEILALGETVNSVNLKKAYQIAFLISTLYYTLTVSSKKQGTIGNMVFKIMVIDIKDEVREDVSKVEYLFSRPTVWNPYFEETSKINSLKYEAVKDGSKLKQFEYYFPFPSENINLTINIYDLSSNILGSKTMLVPLEANRKTIVTGELFSSLGDKELTIVLDDIWEEDWIYEFQ